MSEFPDTPYSIRESDRFIRHAEFELGDLERWDEIKEAFDLFLGRDPYAFEAVPGTSYRAVVLATVPQLAVYFSIDDIERVVTLEGIART